MAVVVILLLWISYFAYGTEGNNCTQDCDKYGTGTPVVLCGTDHETHSTRYSVFSCYRFCDVSLLYPGACGCPNNCYNTTGWGNCVNGACQCSSGWQGEDCSSIQCPNACSNHGRCIAASSAEEIDRCECDSRWTSIDCSVPSMQRSVLPYGELRRGRYWSDKEEYGDYHPLFNLETVAVIHLQVNPANLTWLLTPNNMYSDLYFPCNVTFDNGNTVERINSAGIKLKGNWGRTYMKKSFTVSFKQAGIRFYGEKKVGLKATASSSSSGDTILRNQLVTELERAMLVPSYRSRYAQLWINGVHFGVYWVHESIDDLFAEARFETHKGNFYKPNNPSSYLSYLGDDPEIYKSYYEQIEGDEDFADLIDLTKALNEPVAELLPRLKPQFNIDAYVTQLLVESVLMFNDGYTSNGNNFALYNQKGQFQFVTYDFDTNCRNPGTRSPSNLHSYIFRSSPVLSWKIMSFTNYNESMYEQAWTLLNNALNPDLGDKSALHRVSELESFITPILTRDQFYPMNSGKDYANTMEEFHEAANQTRTFFANRYADVAAQLNSWFSSDQLVKFEEFRRKRQ